MKQKIIPILSVLVGIVAFALTANYIRMKEKVIKEELARIYAGARKITVVAAARDIPGQTVIRREDIGAKEIFEAQASDRVITADQASLILSRKTEFKVQAGKPILWTDIEGGAPSDRGLAAIITPGMRAISLSVGGAQAVDSMVRPNDRIDVLGTFTLPSAKTPGEMEMATLTVLQDVTVLATGQDMATKSSPGRSSSKASYRTVTLEVTPREAELLVFAQQVKGRLTLSLRNPSDVSFEQSLPNIDFDHIQSRLPELNLSRQRNIRHKRNL